ncbi:MAG: glycosyltransferase family 39 protein [Dehalococcoidia bacterium]|nr:MAG: glycosyltransferase family 39 protein [Dehalococcoidia bacterium]
MQKGILVRLRSFFLANNGRLRVVLFFLALSLIIRLLLNHFVYGHGPDLNLFGFWFHVAADQGIPSFYDSVSCDYPPLNIYLFWLFGKLGIATDMVSQTQYPVVDSFIVKLPGTLFDIATAYLIYRLLSQRFSFKVSLGVMALYAFNLATVFDLSVWGQMDSIYTFFMVASLYSALRSRYELSVGILALAILTKPQSIVLLPVIGYMVLRQGDWRRIISSSVAFIAVVYLSIIAFNWDSPIAFILDRYLGTDFGYNYYQFNTINAYNFWALGNFWKSDVVPHWGLTYQQWGILAFAAFTVFVLWQLHRRYEPRSAIYAVFLLTFGFFMLMTRIHERYLFSIFALLALGWYTRYTIWLYLGLAATFIANLAYVLALAGDNVFWIPDGHWSIYVLVPANIILFALSIWNFYRMQRAKPPDVEVRPPPPELTVAGETVEQPPPAKEGINIRSAPFWVAVLTIFFFVVSAWNLGDIRTPSRDFYPAGNEDEVILELEEPVRVDRVFLLLQDASNVDVDIYWGTPESWTLQTNMSRSGQWRKWESEHLGQETGYVRLVFKGGSGRIGEVALYSGEHRLDITSVTGSSGGSTAALTDEQDIFTHAASYKSGTYFDEIYYVRAAEEHIRLEVPYGERTHPPTSKLIIMSSIGIFGYNPFAWRIAGVILATLMIPLIYFFARNMFNSTRAGLIAAFLLTFDLMHLAEARIATPETFILFFIMGMFYFFYRYWQDPEHRGRDLFISLAFFGLGFSTKWVVMWGFVGLILLLLLLKWRKPIYRREVYWFAGGIFAAVSIYMISNIPYFLAGWTLGDFWDYQWSMFRFHSSLTASHPYSSEWYTWPLMLKPLWMYVGHFNGTSSYIATFGNPALWWASIFALLATLWLAVRHRNRTALFIVVPFLTQWLIFAAIGRCLFIYHFYPNVLFLVLATTLWVHWLWDRFRWGKWAVSSYLTLNVVCFAFFYPIISGLPMANGYWDWLNWVREWVIYGLFG